MDVLWVIHRPFVEVLQHCIDRVAASGVSQRVLLIEDYSALDEAGREALITEPLLTAFQLQPVIIVWCLHVGNPGVYHHYQNAPARLNIILEHDLFSTEPEGGVATQNPHELLIFTRQHWMSRLAFSAPGRVFTPTRWYKVDAYLRQDAQRFLESPEYSGYDKWQYAMFTESLFYSPGPFTKGEPFRAVYHKAWKAEPVRSGTIAAPVNIAGPLGTVSAQHLAGFWISRKSSILAEAVFHGCIPIIHEQPETDECATFFLQESPSLVYPLSRVQIDKHNPANGQFMVTQAVTTTGDFNAKIRALQQDPELRATVLKEIARQWMFGPLETTPLPSVDEVILTRLEELGWTP